MKAWHIMLFLLLFNLSVSVVSTLHIYVMPTTPYYNVTTYSSTANGAFYSIFGNIILTFISSAIAASFIRVFTRIPSAAAYVYSLFAGVFITITVNSFSVLWGIAPGNAGLVVVLVIFGIITGGIFLGGMAQIVGGAWSGIE